MVCKTCGSQLNPNDKFCRYCGTTVPAEPQQPPVQQAAPQAPIFTPTYTPVNQSAPNPVNTGAQYTPGSQTYTPGQNAYVPPQPKAPGRGAHLKPAEPRKPGKKPGKGLLIGGIAAAAVLVIALVVVLILTGNPTIKVATAFKNTASEFSKVMEVWNMDEAAEFSKKEAVSVSAGVKLNSINENYMGYYAEAVSGLGASFDMDVNLENREMGLMASVNMGSAELVSAMISAEDEMLYVGAPDFLDDFYGVNTETMMQDLEDMGAGLGEAAQISFNIFELMDIVREYSGDSEEMRQAIVDATTQLAKELTIEKAGKENVKVNGESLKCQAYTVTIPQDALEEWFEALEDAATTSDPMEMMEELYNAMNLPEYIVEELMYEMRYSYVEPDFSEITEILDVLGDIELQVYVKSNKVAGILYKEKIEGTKVEIGLYIGGGDRYVDNLSLEMKIDGEKVVIESEGDHTAKEGAFTDSMTVSLPDGTEIEVETEYDPKSGALSLELGNRYASFVMEGTYLVSADSCLLELDELRAATDGEELFSVAVSYEVTDYEKRVKVSDARLLSDLTEDDIMNLATELEGNAMEWVLELYASHPELVEMLDF